MGKNMVKSLLVFIIGIFLCICFCVCFIYNGNDIVFENKSKNKNNSFVAMMIETDAKSGKYTQSTTNEWLTDGYVFNSDLSGCENGSSLSWDDTNKKVIMESNITDKCYVYFDKIMLSVVNSIETVNVSQNSITLSIDSMNGTYDVSKYYYSLDNGSTWNESLSNIITISNLKSGTSYTILIRLLDSASLYSDIKSIIINTTSGISFTIDTVTYYADPGMTWKDWIDSEYNTRGFYYFGRKGIHITTGNDGSIGLDKCTPVDDLTLTIVENYSYLYISYEVVRVDC